MKTLSTQFTKIALVMTTICVTTGCSAVANTQVADSNVNKNATLQAKAIDNALLYSDECITEREVVNAQKMWGNGIVRIGSVYSNNGDYALEAADFIQDMYGYDLSSVLFKPTLAANDQFRSSFDAALSYFVGGNDAYAEDKGFAIKPYTNVKFDNVGIINNSCRMAVAMGNYFFTDTSGGETKVEYTFAYVKDSDGDLRIVAHQSSLPYNPASN
ncbi:phosphoribosyl-AMP cyclohydrolase [Alteromonas sp. 009811495]|uniref:phosphoribosyl-AMP cyclohydrolase n=1 Tax=Alteromonas sp. 009811495 TaxID=3002962 RepID=UPI00237D6BA2|nr:phosphoribosyl-AMP cyclohydrolase [Alteromonas sp. 009811495]WDT84639.1 phosphoribosyl-AMP cyclohydrolase [Alteromonas sp. 009811495]